MPLSFYNFFHVVSIVCTFLQSTIWFIPVTDLDLFRLLCSCFVLIHPCTSYFISSYFFLFLLISSYFFLFLLISSYFFLFLLISSLFRLTLFYDFHFSFRQAPFFVLDEVDAALDNVNVKKVITLFHLLSVYLFI